MNGILRSCTLVGLTSALFFIGPGVANTQAPGTSEAKSTPPVSTPAGDSSSALPVSSSSTGSANLLGAARDLYRKGNFDEAVAKYQLFATTHPNSPDAFAGITRVYLKQKKLDLAAKTVTEALGHSDAPRLHVALGEVYFRQGRLTDAEKEWVNTINSGHAEARAYLGLARVRQALAMYESSKKMIDKAHALDPEDPDVEEEWTDTLTRSERIHYLETALAGPNAWDGDERADMARYLDYLHEREKQHTSPCRLVSKTTHTETPLVRLLIDPTHLRGYGLTVSLNGHKSNLMLDTGAGGITVKRSIAEHAGITKFTETKIWGIGDKGKRNAYIGIADDIRVGDLEFKNCPIDVMESRSVADEDGLIGADVFDDFLVEIDFPNEKLRLSELPQRPGSTRADVGLSADPDDEPEDSGTSASPDAGKSGTSAPTSPRFQDRYIAPEMQSYSRVFRFGHDLLVPTTIGNVPAKLFLLDTGAMFNAISPSAAREVTKLHGDDDWTVRGLSGKVEKVYTANKAVLQFGHLRQQNLDLTSFDTTHLSDDIGTEISGFLGFTTLRLLDVKIDYRDALVNFEYSAKP